jgi:hypothetical protein
MKYFVIVLLAAAFILAYGCVQVSPPENCASLSIVDQPGCVYYAAVMNQDPYACYALKNESQRSVCLKDAIDPSAKKVIAKKRAVISPGLLTNRSTGLRTPSANPNPAPIGTPGTLGNTTQPAANITAPVRTPGGLQNPS